MSGTRKTHNQLYKKQDAKKLKKEIEKNIMKSKLEVKEISDLLMTPSSKRTVKKAMGGVLKNRGGMFKGTY